MTALAIFAVKFIVCAALLNLIICTYHYWKNKDVINQKAQRAAQAARSEFEK